MLEGKRRRSNWVHKEANLMFRLRSGKDQRKNSLSRSNFKKPVQIGCSEFNSTVSYRPHDNQDKPTY